MMKKLSVVIIVMVIFFLVIFKEKKEDSKVLPQIRPVSKERAASSASPIKEETSHLSDYQHQLERAFKSLPTKDDLVNLSPQEVHHTPEMIMEGGEVIGKIHQEAELDPTKRSKAMSFFGQCAEDREIATALRAVCLSKVYKLVPRWQIPAAFTLEISAEVEELALKLP